jgi:hypothetical protein
MGVDLIYDDMDGFTQKISQTRKPYRYELLAEREFLVPATTKDGSPFLGKEGLEYRNVTMERRPCYVMKLTQLDPTYVYSYRIIYIDKETFVGYRFENFDRKERLYRTLDAWHWGWFPEMGQLALSGGVFLAVDHQDIHSTIIYEYELPACWTREEVNLQGFKMAK